MKTSISALTVTVVWVSTVATLFAGPAPDSARLARAKTFIADEQWGRAVAELQAVVDDRKEASRDEALYWLAESEHELGDQASAIQTIARIEREFPSSRWVHPARSLMVEIAQRMRRDDMLWAMVTPRPAAAPVAPTPPAGLPPAPPAPPAPGPVPMRPALATPPSPVPRTPRALAPPAPAFLASFPPDSDLQIEALGGLLDDHAMRVIPLLKEIALDKDEPNAARRAVFVLSQSSRPEAQQTILEIARKGAGPARVAAIRELGRFTGPMVAGELMQVYADADSPLLKRQVVVSLGERADTRALMQIATTEDDSAVRDSAILTLGRAAARTELRTLYVRSSPQSRPVVLSALFNAKDDEGLIQIAHTEKDAALRRRAIQQLRMLATPKAEAFLSSNQR